MLHSADLCLNPAKCEIAVRKFKILSIEVAAEEISPDSKKLTVIAEMSCLKDVVRVGRFLSAAGFFHWYINGFTRLAAPLTS